MVQKLEDLLEKKVSVLLPGGSKGLVKVKGIVTDINDEEGIITLQTEGGIMGGKKKRTVFFAYSILGIEIEE